MLRTTLKNLLPEKMLHTYRVKRYGLRYVRRVTNGMLNTEIYEQICAKIQRGPDLDFLEVGGAGGAATIAIAWGKRDAGMKSKVIVVEKFEGGSRDRYGTRQTNYERYQKHMRDFKATSYISLFDNYLTFDNAADVLALRTTKKLAGMMLDADGMIHRDFSLFFNELADDALIVIDDYHETKSEKHARTWRLLNQLIDWGYFQPDELIGDTYFGRKPNVTPAHPIDLELCQRLSS